MVVIIRAVFLHVSTFLKSNGAKLHLFFFLVVVILPKPGCFLILDYDDYFLTFEVEKPDDFLSVLTFLKI